MDRPPAVITRCRSAGGVRYAAPARRGKSSTRPFNGLCDDPLVIAVHAGAENASPCVSTRSCTCTPGIGVTSTCERAPAFERRP